MIIKGGAAGNVGWWSQHLQRDDTNERAEVMEISGLLSTDLPSALREMQAIADQSRSRGNFMYQANINPRDNETLTPEQWKVAVDTLEKNLGFEGHQRVVVEHEKEGRTHRHVIWNRVDVETLKISSITGNYQKHTETARELESILELSPTPAPTRSAKPERAPELWEIRAAERSGIDPNTMKEEITNLWNSTDSGKAFAAAVQEQGYILAKGDRRDFCIIDAAGDAHSLARRLGGVSTQDMRARMSDINRESLPTVADARADRRAEIQSERIADRAEKAFDRATAQDAPAPRAGNPRDGIKVVNAATGLAESLGGFITNLLAGGSAAAPMPANQVEKIRQQRKALAALERIAEQMERGEDLKAEDIQALTPTHLANIHRQGDDYMRNLIERMEYDRQREQEYGRARER